MKYPAIIILSLLLFPLTAASAQDYASQPAPGEQFTFPLFVPVDSAAPRRNLLPENASVMEKGLWGENGLFRTTGLAAPLTVQARLSELKLRRTMLTMHFIGGFVALGSMIGASYYGQRVIDYNQRGDRNRHQLFVTSAIISYSATAFLAILAPPPLIRRDEMSTITIHKTLAWVHFIGMVLTPILGASIGRRMTRSETARFHQVSAYVTTSAMAASLIVLSF